MKTERKQQHKGDDIVLFGLDWVINGEHTFLFFLGFETHDKLVFGVNHIFQYKFLNIFIIFQFLKLGNGAFKGQRGMFFSGLARFVKETASFFGIQVIFGEGLLQ